MADPLHVVLLVLLDKPDALEHVRDVVDAPLLRAQLLGRAVQLQRPLLFDQEQELLGQRQQRHVSPVRWACRPCRGCCAAGNVHAHHAAAGVHVASRALDAVVVVVVDRHRHNNLLRLLVHKVCRAGPHLIPTSRVRCCRCSCCW